jgi:hypothetical protein
MYGVPARRGEKLYQYYRCPTCRRLLPLALADATIWAWLKGALLDQENLTRKLRRQQAEREAEMRPLRERLDIIEELLADQRRQLGKLLDDYLVDLLPRDMLAERKSQLQEAAGRLEEERANLQAYLTTQVLTDEQVRTIEDLAAQVHAALVDVDEDFAFKRQLLELLDAQALLMVEDGQKVAHARCIIAERVLRLLSVAPCSTGIPAGQTAARQSNP